MFAPAFVDRAAGTGISVGLHFLSLIPFIVFVAALWSRLARASQILAMMAVLGGFGTVMVIAIWQAAVAGVLLQANFVDPTADLRPILAFISSLDQSVTLPLGIFAGAAGLAILGSRIFSPMARLARSRGRCPRSAWRAGDSSRLHSEGRPERARHGEPAGILVVADLDGRDINRPVALAEGTSVVVAANQVRLGGGGGS